MQISEGIFNCPDTNLYHKAYILAHVDGGQVSFSENTPAWVILVMTHLTRLYGWIVLV